MARPSVVMGRVSFVVLLAVLWIAFPLAAIAEIVSNPNCLAETVFYPGEQCEPSGSPKRGVRGSDAVRWRQSF